MRTQERARWARLRAFATAIVAVAILAVLMYLLTGGTLLKPKATLITYVDDSLAMENGSPVLMDGVRIGKVTLIQLSGLKDPRKAVEVRFWVERRYLQQIPVDSQTVLSSENVLGDKFIDINAGKSPEHVRDNSVLAQQPPSVMISRLDITQFTEKLRSVDALFQDIQAGKGTMGEFVKGDKLYRDMLGRVTELQKSVDKALSTKSTLGGAVYTHDLYSDLSLSLQRLDGALGDLQAGRGPMGKLLVDPAAYEEARSQMAGIRRAVGEAGAGSFLASDELYASMNRKVASLIQAVDDFNAGQGAGEHLAHSQVYESLDGAARELQKELREFREHPQKFMRLRLRLF